MVKMMLNVVVVIITIRLVLVAIRSILKRATVAPCDVLISLISTALQVCTQSRMGPLVCILGHPTTGCDCFG